MVTTLLIGVPLVDDAMSSLLASAQEINATASNETTKDEAGDDQVNTQVKLDGNKSSDEARKLYDEGQALLKLKKFNEAIASFDKALAINPNNTGVLSDKQKALDALSRVK